MDNSKVFLDKKEQYVFTSKPKGSLVWMHYYILGSVPNGQPWHSNYKNDHPSSQKSTTACQYFVEIIQSLAHAINIYLISSMFKKLS